MEGGYLQNPNPDFAADMNLSLAMTLPLITPSASIPATFTLVSSANSVSRSSTFVIPNMIDQDSLLRRDVGDVDFNIGGQAANQSNVMTKHNKTPLLGNANLP